ncbi:hypothetical protein MHYP_G00335980 [Metynnis hypsauchen]
MSCIRDDSKSVAWEPQRGPFIWADRPRKRRRCRKRGRRAGVLVRLRQHANRPPLPSILLANVQSLDNKISELSAGISFQRETRDCCIICLREAWLSAEIPTQATEPADRTKGLSGKSKGGGVCFMISHAWCGQRNVHFIKSFCSPDLEYLIISCRPTWLRRDFRAHCQRRVHPTKANFREVAPKFFQHISCSEDHARWTTATPPSVRCTKPSPTSVWQIGSSLHSA